MASSFKMKLHACVAGAVMFGAAAHAQEVQLAQAAPAPQAPVAGERAGIDTIVVTAEKREVELNDIPVAISAFSSEKMETVGIQTVSDIANFTPGLAHSLTNDRLTVRGVGRFTNTRATEGGVAIYLDGLYTSTASALQKSDMYIDRFEVLRGPQGTLYGRNSVGGAVNLISKHPTKEWSGELRADFSNFDRTDFEGSISGPITDHFRFKIAGNKVDQKDGYYHNVATNIGTGTDEGMVENRSYYEIQLEGEALNDKFEWWLLYGTERWDNSGGGTTGRATSTIGFYNNKTPVVGQTPNLLYGYGNGLRPEDTNYRNFASSGRTPVIQDIPHIVAHATYHMPMFDLKYVGGYSSYNYYSDGPANGLDRVQPFTLTSADFANYNASINNPNGLNPLALAPPGTSVTIDPNNRNLVQQYVWWHSNELNLASTYEGPFQILAGLYEYNEGANDYLSNVYNPNQPQYATLYYPNGTLAPAPHVLSDNAPGASNVPDYLMSASGADTHTETYGAYAQGDWQFTKTLKATLGLRYTYDKKEVYERARIVCFLGSTCNPTLANGLNPLLAYDVSAAVYNPDAGAVRDPSVVVPTFTNTTTGFRERGLAQHWDALTYTLGLDWTPQDGTLVYLKNTKGYKAGGFNSGTLSQFTTTDPETIYLYEVGAKQSFGKSLQVNGSLYYEDYRKVQIPLTQLNTATQLNETRFVNMPKAEIGGIELEATWNPISTLQILANYSYLYTNIKEACCFVDPQDGAAVAPGADPIPNAPNPTARAQDLAGNQLPFATPQRFTTNVNYTWRFDAGSLTPSVSFVWKGKTYYSVFNRPYNEGRGGSTIDARLLWTEANDKYRIIAYVRNLTNQTVEEGVSASLLGGSARAANGSTPAYLGDLNYSWSLNPPRTYGVELQYKF